MPASFAASSSYDLLRVIIDGSTHADLRAEKLEDAERFLQRSLWLDPDSTGPYILLGKVLEKKGDFELAARTLQRALAMDPNNPLPHYMLGQAYNRMGRDEDAQREFKLSEQLRQGRALRHEELSISKTALDENTLCKIAELVALACLELVRISRRNFRAETPSGFTK